jgi:hypothetical protein
MIAEMMFAEMFTLSKEIFAKLETFTFLLIFSQLLNYNILTKIHAEIFPYITIE